MQQATGSESKNPRTKLLPKKHGTTSAAKKKSWSSTISTKREIEKLTDEAYNDYESVRGRFEDAGVGAGMEELSKDEDAHEIMERIA